LIPQIGVLYTPAAEGLAGYYSFSQPRLGIGSDWIDPASAFNIAGIGIHQFGLIASFADDRWLVSLGGFYLEQTPDWGPAHQRISEFLELGAGSGTELRISGR